MAKISAGLLMYRVREGRLQVLLVHPGGPFWARKEAGAWFMPKGELAPGESEIEAARREFTEETGLAPGEPVLPLGSVKNASGKTIFAYAFAGDADPAAVRSNTFEMEWPPKSGRRRQFPEVDRAAFFTWEQAQQKMSPAELELFRRLREALALP